MKIRAALDKGEMDEVLRLATLAKEYDNAMDRACKAANQIISPARTKRAPDLTNQASRVGVPSRKARGSLRRSEYLRKLETEGIRLSRVRGRIYETASGRRVGIAYASEVVEQKWWMGLLDEQYDVVVLLCESRAGEIIDFVLPSPFVQKFWPILSRNGKQREMHVQQVGANYEIEPGKDFGKINQYMSNRKDLR